MRHDVLAHAQRNGLASARTRYRFGFAVLFTANTDNELCSVSALVATDFDNEQDAQECAQLFNDSRIPDDSGHVNGSYVVIPCTLTNMSHSR